MTRHEFSKAICAAPGCEALAVIQTTLGRCCNKHYLRVRAHGAFELPTRTLNRHVICAVCGSPFDRGYSINSKRAKARQFCSPECSRLFRNQTASRRLAERFWALVDRRGPNDCWPWIGRRANGYGAFDYKGRPHIASRMAFALATGNEPGPLEVCHSCDNPPCCNPGHLWVGTHRENVEDMYAKGRGARIVALRGESHPGAKLTVADIHAIRQSSDTARSLAIRFGVTAANIYRIKKHLTWRSL